MKQRYIKFKTTLALIFLAISVPVLIITTTVQVYSHSVDLYKAGFDKYNISQKTGISGQQLDRVAQKMVDYFSGKSQTPQVTVTKKGIDQPLYNEKELVHLEDVCNIVRLFTYFQIASILLFILLVVFLYLKRKLPELLTTIQIGAIITGALTGILVVWALIDFKSLFLLFHYISFTNDLWILDPSRDYLIMLFPEGFFNDAAVLIITTIIVEAAIIWLAVFFIKRVYAGKSGVTK